MHNWRNIDITLTYDGNYYGLLSVVFWCFMKKVTPRDITPIQNYTPTLFNDVKEIPTIEKNAEFLKQKIIKISDLTLYKTYTSHLSKDKNKEIKILNYLKDSFIYGKTINSRKSLESVININDMCKKVGGEAHKLKGFLRFMEIENNALYAEISPENNVIEILAEHFKKRLKNENWLIIDLNRNIGAVYENKECIIMNLDNSKLNLIHSKQEKDYQVLWKNYFKDISIEERKNRRCQLNFMPKRYWKHLIEEVE